MRKLAFEEVAERARERGLAPDFGASAWTGTKARLRWRCLADPAHALTCAFSDLPDRCTQCARFDASPKKLTFEEVTARAREVGMEPAFAEGEYGGNKANLPWRCLTDGSHVVVAQLQNLTGCHDCRRLQGGARRLSFEDVTERAMACGFRPGFEDGEYAGNQQLLPWICRTDRRHVVTASLAHLSRGCPDCRKASSEKERREGLAERIRSILKGRGDKLLSTADEIDTTRSAVRYRCGHCGEEAAQIASKLLAGQVHACQQMAAAHAVRRQAAYDDLKDELRASGLVLETTLQEYEGARSRIKVRKVGGHDARLLSVQQARKLAETMLAERGCGT